MIMQKNSYKKLILPLFLLFATVGQNLMAQTEEALDTIFNPAIHYSNMPKEYEIAGITVSGVDNYEDYVLIGFSGLSVGQKLAIPGEDITTAIKRFWRQGLFSDVSITITKTYGDLAWLNIALKQRPRISEINYNGIKKSEREDLIEKLGLVKGNQITPNVIDRVKMLVTSFFKDKGFDDVTVVVRQKDDPSQENHVMVDIDIDKNEKIKVNKIFITGNEALTENKIERTMKKTNEKGKLVNLFRTKKFVREEFDNDLSLIIDKYNELGYRDATIMSDSVVRLDDKKVDVYITLEEGNQYYIKEIIWVGNTIYPSELLTNVLNMKPGDVYDQRKIQERTLQDDDAVSNLYMDKGYLFFNVEPIEANIENDSIQLEMRIYEGQQATINKVIISGNDRLYEQVVRRELRTKPGQLFSKSDLVRSAREIAQTGHFDAENMDIRPEPDPETGTVDLIYGLQSKANDQIEFSAGWGSTGVIGKLSLKFTNFSVNNLLNPDSYKGIIPQGEGQTFTLSAQTNASYYQSYSVSFFDSWFGGKRPNSFSLTAYYSKQSDVSSEYYSDSYYNYYSSYNSYGSSYSSSDYSYAIDPDKSIEMLGLAAGFGKRLTWPDDYFSLTAELGYTRYMLNDWDYLSFMQDGTANSITLGLTLSRSSIDNPIYTRRGSQFSLSVKFTPPYSLFDGVDYQGIMEGDDTDAQQAAYKWIEYHKWKLNTKTFTPLVTLGASHTLVLMTRADIGILGSYNSYKKSPFETFYVGGDGMSGTYSSSYATETVALRGYSNGSLTPYGYDGYAYARFALELRMPILLETSSTIYALAFAEAGNAWQSVSDFNPFDLARSAGVGARIYLPMIGMMGIDGAYGFDSVLNDDPGWEIHFILGQEF